jgi:hypothetical protein
VTSAYEDTLRSQEQRLRAASKPTLIDVDQDRLVVVLERAWVGVDGVARRERTEHKLVLRQEARGSLVLAVGEEIEPGDALTAAQARNRRKEIA